MSPLVVLTFLILSNILSCMLTVNATKMQLKSANELRKLNKKIPKNNKVVITEYGLSGKRGVIKCFLFI